jgi:hypothetical protein
MISGCCFYVSGKMQLFVRATYRRPGDIRPRLNITAGPFSVQNSSVANHFSKFFPGHLLELPELYRGLSGGTVASMWSSVPLYTTNESHTINIDSEPETFNLPDEWDSLWWMLSYYSYRWPHNWTRWLTKSRSDWPYGKHSITLLASIPPEMALGRSAC